MHIKITFRRYIGPFAWISSGQWPDSEHFGITAYHWAQSTRKLLWGILEFELVPSEDGEIELDLWTTFSGNQGYTGQYNDPVVATDQSHPRGYWPFSNILTRRLLSINFSGISEAIEMRCATGATPGSLAFAWRGSAEDPYGSPPSGNKGLYGVISTYQFQVYDTQNPHPDVNYWLLGRGGRFFGATANALGQVFGIPVIGPPTPPNTDTFRIEWASYNLGEGVAFLEVFCVGGAASTPFSLYLRRVPS